MMVSDDMPVESTPLSTVISGVAPPGSTVDNHCDITAGSGGDVAARALQSVDICRPQVHLATGASFAEAITIRWVAL